MIETADRDFLCQADDEKERDAWLAAISEQLLNRKRSRRVSVQVTASSSTQVDTAKDAEEDFRTTANRLAMERLASESIRISQQQQLASRPIYSQVLFMLFVVGGWVVCEKR